MLNKVLVAVSILLVSYLYTKVRYKRLQQYARFPQITPSPILGHLQTVDDFVKRAPPRAHPDVAFAAMHNSLGRPPVMFVDLRPITTPMLVIGSYEVAEQIVKTSNKFPYSPPKVWEVWKHMVSLSGPTSILSSGGEDWKALRKRFNPGFAPQHLMTLLPAIIEKTKLFTDRLDSFVYNEQEFSLQSLATNLTFDVIGRVVLNVDMGAQTSSPTAFMRAFHELIETFNSEHIDLPWWCTPRLQWKRSRLSKVVRSTLKTIIEERFNENKLHQGTQGRSVLSMSLQDVEILSQETINVTCDQLSSFLFAGHDTTSTTIGWVFYELSRTPHALHAVRAELEGLFGPDPSPAAIAARLSAAGGYELIQRMSYTSAVIKETLRLWPPGATARIAQPGDGLHLDLNTNNRDKALNVDGLMLYHVHSIIHRDPAVFGETANAFVPERWLGQAAEKIPTGAWRAFERGPRNCIGQELALIEARVVVAMTARQYDFLKVGIGALALDSVTGKPEAGEHGQYRVTEEMYQTRQVTAKPVDGMVMQVKFAV